MAHIDQIDDTDSNEDDLYEHHRFVAGAGQVPLRVDKFLMNFVENATRNKIQQAAKAGSVFVNDVAVKSNHKVKPHDVVKVLFAHPPYENLLTPENIALDIVYEDDVLLVVNKPAACQRTRNNNGQEQQRCNQYDGATTTTRSKSAFHYCWL